MTMTLSLFMNGPLGLAFLAVPLALAAGSLAEAALGAVQVTLRAGRRARSSLNRWQRSPSNRSESPEVTAPLTSWGG